MITTLAVGGYRSLRDVVVPLSPLTVVTGGNGTGKSSLYRALRLLAQCGEGEVVGSLAREGGLQSALWAGPESLAGARRGAPVEGIVRKGPISVRMGYASDDFGYLVDLGLPQPTGLPTAFQRDPQVKRELIFSGPVMRPGTTSVRRRRGSVQVRDERRWVDVAETLPAYRSVLREYADPQVAPEVFKVREHIRSWRFYDGFRVDAEAPARRPQVGTRTPVLSGDGSDLAAAVQTILKNGFGDLERTIADAFDGARPEVLIADGIFDVAIAQPGMLRPLRAAELSDGTLRYLLLATALLTVDPPALMVLNEPETSLHAALVAPLARLIATASRRSQVVVVTHSRTLIDALREGDDRVTEVVLDKNLGETVVEGQGLLSRPPWEWGSR
ncbi:ATP-binding protein [Flexivirga endophytica]|uniref:ATP-binding protein n=1 Tax=Flexivirga endophytica TaxID=1849103 RepID=A0A916WQ79_9MICO|nr:AAA family ATPase [Flexivirga endophytica]GGB20130.1 ATP-binding protein [Flexivirga endophytica]GHB35544.1 ATP-binding protein [Flexivirga endophytica]